MLTSLNPLNSNPPSESPSLREIHPEPLHDNDQDDRKLRQQNCTKSFHSSQVLASHPVPKSIQDRQGQSFQRSWEVHDFTIHSTGCDESVQTKQANLADQVFEQFYSGRALAKMLINCDEEPAYHRRDRYFHELKHTGKVRSDSVSLLTPSIPLELFRHTGFIVDADKAIIRFIQSIDADTVRINNEGREVEWDSRITGYSEVNGRKVAYYNYEYDSTPSTYFGKFRTIKYKLCPQFSSIFDLQDASAKAAKVVSWYYFTNNELVVNYDSESIIAVLAGQNTNSCEIKKLRHLNQEHTYIPSYADENPGALMALAIELRDCAKKELGKLLPIFRIDCLTGTLELVEEAK